METGMTDGSVTVDMSGEDMAPRETLLGADESVTEGASPEGATPTPEKSSAVGAAGEYEAFTLPDGIDPADATVGAALDEAKGAFREMGLTQQQAQRLIDLHMKHYIGALADDDERFNREVDRRVAAWGLEVKADPDFGGSRLNESLTSVKRAIANLGGEPLRLALTDETGLINHPEIFKAFARMGRHFSEDKLVMGQNGKVPDMSPSGMAARVYPNMRRG